MTSIPFAQSGSFASRLAVASLLFFASLQWLIAFADGASWQRIACVAIFLGSWIALFAPVAMKTRLAILVVLAFIGFANLILYAVSYTQPEQLRLVLLCVLCGYTMLGIAGVAALIWKRRAPELVMSALMATIALVVIEVVIENTSEGPTRNVVRWEGGTVPDPVLEESYPPNSTARTIYVSNPRGYFENSDPRAQQWRLGSNHPGSSARLQFPGPPASGRVRVDIDRAEIPTPWHVQLTSEGLRVRKGEPYTLRFKARAEQRRPFSYGVSQAHPPWDNLGWYRNIDIDTEWSEVVETFRATSSDDLARLTFDLGAHTSAVEIEGLEVKRFDTGENAIREPTPEYSVTYRFNDRGCRGPDYQVPRPADVLRVLVLGDSYVLGVGVHEQDTFTAQLQEMLSKRADNNNQVEVINCGVSGYSTAQARLLFERLGEVYRPDLVILGMVMNDDSSWRSDVANNYFHQPGRLDALSMTWRVVQYARHQGRKPPADFSGSLSEVRLLQARAEAQGANLVVFSFRNHPLSFEAWQSLAQTMSTGLKDTGVPWLDVGDRVITDDTWRTFLVHPEGDMHPNEIFHRSAAEQVTALLIERGLVP